MSRRSALCTFLHAILAFALLATGISAPAWRVATVLVATQDATMTMPCADMGDMGDMGDMATSSSDRDVPPTGQVPAHPCDLSACLGTACTPSPVLRLVAYIPPSTPDAPAAVPLPPSAVLDTPLRPPIA